MGKNRVSGQSMWFPTCDVTEVPAKVATDRPSGRRSVSSTDAVPRRRNSSQKHVAETRRRNFVEWRFFDRSDVQFSCDSLVAAVGFQDLDQRLALGANVIRRKDRCAKCRRAFIRVHVRCNKKMEFAGVYLFRLPFLPDGRGASGPPYAATCAAHRFLISASTDAYAGSEARFFNSSGSCSRS